MHYSSIALHWPGQTSMWPNAGFTVDDVHLITAGNKWNEIIGTQTINNSDNES